MTTTATERAEAEALQRRIEDHCEQYARDECDAAGHPRGEDGCPCGEVLP